jgi:hypothetical protein
MEISNFRRPFGKDYPADFGKRCKLIPVVAFALELMGNGFIENDIGFILRICTRG